MCKKGKMSKVFTDNSQNTANLAEQIAKAEGLKGSQLEERVAKLKMMSLEKLNEMLQSGLNGSAVKVEGCDEDWGHMDVHFSKDTASAQKQPQPALSKNGTESVDYTSQITYEETQELAINKLEEDVEQGLASIANQDDGLIGKTYEKIKESLNSNLSKSATAKALYVQNETAQLLKQAKANDLTKEEYLGSLQNTLYDIFPDIEKRGEKEQNLILSRIKTLSPAQLNRWRDNVLKLPSGKSENYTDSVSNFEKLFEKETTTEKTSTFNNGDNINFSKKEILTNKEYRLQEGTGKELMTFDQVFKLERGVEFKPENIEKFNTETIRYAFLSDSSEKLQNIHKTLDDSISLVKLYDPSMMTEEARKLNENRLNQNLYFVLKDLYGDDPVALNDGLRKLSEFDGIEFDKEGKITYIENPDSPFKMPIIQGALTNIGSNILKNLDKNNEKMMGGSTLEDYKKDYAESYNNAYGKKNAAQFADAYIKDQQGAVKAVRTGIEYAGAGIMVAGVLFYPPIALAGGAISSFGGVGTEMVDEVTKKNVSKEKLKELSKELIVNGTLMAAGYGAGTAGNAAKASLLAQNCPKLVAATAGVGADAAISLVSTLALTGQVSLEGEGFSQIMSLVLGHKSLHSVRAKKAPDDILFNKEYSPKYTQEQNINISNNARNMHAKALADFPVIKSDFKKIFPSNSSWEISSRVKKLDTLFEKEYRILEKYDKMIEKAKAAGELSKEDLAKGKVPATPEQIEAEVKRIKAQKEASLNDLSKVNKKIQDVIGARLVMSDNSPEAVDKVFKNLLKSVDKGEIKLLEINNYCGEGLTPYLSSVQVKELYEHCLAKGYEPVVISPSDGINNTTLAKKFNTEEALKKSGYTTAQFNIQHKNGAISEFQIRGNKINELAESEHIIYDIREGKVLNNKIPELAKVEKLVQEIDLPENAKLKEDYSKYLTECYQYARMQELNMPMKEPVLPEGLDAALDIKNIIKLHSIL